MHRIYAILFALIATSLPAMAQEFVYCPPAVTCTSNIASSCSISGATFTRPEWRVVRTYANLPLEGGTYYFGMVINVGVSPFQEKSPECQYYPEGNIYDANNNVISVGVIGSEFFVANIIANETEWQTAGNGIYSCGRLGQIYDPRACPMVVSRESPQQVYP